MFSKQNLENAVSLYLKAGAVGFVGGGVIMGIFGAIVAIPDMDKKKAITENVEHFMESVTGCMEIGAIVGGLPITYPLVKFWIYAQHLENKVNNFDQFIENLFTGEETDDDHKMTCK